MNGKDIKEIIKTAVSLFLICAVAAGILAYVNSVTAPTIASNSQAAADEARKTLLTEAKEFELTELSDGSAGYIGKDGEKTVGYVFTTSGKGYGGAVEVMTGIDCDGKVLGINILTINETPGLGMNAKKDSFLSQFTGRSGKLAVSKDGGDIDAITSATITSRAVTSAVNQALAYFEEVKEG